MSFWGKQNSTGKVAHYCEFCDYIILDREYRLTHLTKQKNEVRLFFLNYCTLGIWKFLGQGLNGIWAMAMTYTAAVPKLDPLTHCTGQRLNPGLSTATRAAEVGFLTHCATAELLKWDFFPHIYWVWLAGLTIIGAIFYQLSYLVAIFHK